MKKGETKLISTLIIAVFLCMFMVGTVNADCLLFNGVNSYVEIPDAPRLSGGPGKSLTVEARVLPIYGDAIITKYLDWNTKDWGLDINDNVVGFQKEGIPAGQSCQGGNWWAFASEKTLPNKWSHVAFVFDNDNDVVKVFVNGVLSGSRALGCDLLDTSAVVWIGGPGPFYYRRYGTDMFSGYIDEVRIWDIARTEAELYNNMTIGSITGIEEGLVAHWDFERGEDTTILYDRSGNGNHGEIHDAVWSEHAASVEIVSVDAEKEVGRGNPFTVAINIEEVNVGTINRLAGFQLDVSFDPAILEAVQVEEGTFLSSSGGTYWLKPNIDNTKGIISDIACAKTGQGGASGSGTLATITFKAVDAGESYVRLRNISISDPSGNLLPVVILDGNVTVTEYPPWDVNKDGRVDILDLVLVGQHFGEDIITPTEPNPDVNGDGKVGIVDFVLVGQHFGETYSPAAPSSDIWSFDTKYLPVLVRMYQVMEDSSNTDPDFVAKKELLRRIISNTKIGKTQVFQNYPNPFNPETWIPYQLAEDSEVTIRIYNVTGQLIKHLNLGYKEAGSYITKNTAAYWDGTTDVGERVSSGVYFYSIQAEGYSAAEKMIVVQ